MKKLLAALCLPLAILSCKNEAAKHDAAKGSEALAAMLNNYWEERMQLFPVEATGIGDNRYNDRLTITIAGSFRDSLGRFYRHYLDEAGKIDTAGLSTADQVSYRIFCYEMQVGLEGLKYPTHLAPITQFWSFTLDLPQLGSGSGNQPFKTVKDYEDWLKRLSVFPAWADTAIANMRLGMDNGWVLPHALVVKILPQLKAVITTTPEKSIFYEPIRSLADSLPTATKERLSMDYMEAIVHTVNPTYKKLHDFFEKEYLPKARSGSGIKDLPGGEDYYNYCIRLWTTTNLSADSIYNTGLAQVAYLEGEMNKVKEQVGFRGSLQEFFQFISDDKRFFPFTEPKQVIDSFWGIKKLEDPQLKKLFNNVPKTQFTIRQTEAFRAASASAEYNQGSEDGTRPGIFYVPILDPKKFNCVGMSTLFLHEAIPGHHYQISLQQENKDLPKFRRFLWYGAYGEGWAHYCETLGKELGVYNDPYQYFGHLSDAMHRAIRLVVDVGMHSKGMTREEAIKYMREHELVSEGEATSEIERYMAIPGQALSYKTGAMAIAAEREKYRRELGDRFNIASFHDEVLRDGCVPLSILKEKLAAWAQRQK